MPLLRRRDFITGVSVATIPAVAGCSGLGTDGNDDDGSGGLDPTEQSGDGGGSGPDEDSGGSGDPLQVVERSWSTWESQNADAFQDLYHSDAPERQKDYWNDDSYWANFGPRGEVDWTIEDRELLESTEGGATVREVYIWRAPNQPTTRFTYRYELRTENGEWKIWDVTLQDEEELGGSGPDEQSGDGGSGPDEDSGDKEEIREVIQKQLEAFENGNIDRYMETAHPESPVYDNTESALESTFEQVSPENLTVDFTIESIEVLSEGRAEVKVVQTTRADNEEFRDNRIIQVFDMRTDQGEWLFYNSTINDREYLE